MSLPVAVPQVPQDQVFTHSVLTNLSASIEHCETRMPGTCVARRRAGAEKTTGKHSCPAHGSHGTLSLRHRVRGVPCQPIRYGIQPA
jgi:hypothetical protein